MKVETKQNPYMGVLASTWLMRHQAGNQAGYGEERIWEWSGQRPRARSASPENPPACNASRAEYEHRKHIYQRNVALLFDTGYQLPDADYKKLKTTVENALIDLEVARAELDSQTTMPVQALRKHQPAA
jgi:hypothetical protein